MTAIGISCLMMMTVVMAVIVPPQLTDVSAIGISCPLMMAAMAVISPLQLTDASAKYLDCKGCSSRYGFSDRHWLRLVDQGKAPPPTRFGRLVRWNITVLEEWESAGCPACRNMRRPVAICTDEPL